MGVYNYKNIVDPFRGLPLITIMPGKFKFTWMLLTYYIGPQKFKFKWTLPDLILCTYRARKV
jgi:hypothetical protein